MTTKNKALRARRWSVLPAFLVLLAGCSGDWRFKIIDQGDRPVTDGPFPPPIDFRECREPTHSIVRYDADNDGKVDHIRVMSGTTSICQGLDTDNNGTLDTWEVLDKGRVVKRAHDSDGDGRADQVWTYPDPKRPTCALFGPDADGDGKHDVGRAVDLCAAVLPPFAQAPPARGSAAPVAPPSALVPRAAPTASAAEAPAAPH